MRKAAVVIFALAGVAFLATPLTSFAGGPVTGKVTNRGKAEEKEFLFSKFPNPKFCPKNPNPELVKGEKRILPTTQVGAGGALKHAVAAVIDVEHKASVCDCNGT